jgi:hypothetical protein
MTALQELKEYLNENRNWSADMIFNKLESLLEKERHQICEAYKCGYDDGFHSDLSLSEYVYLNMKNTRK